MKRVSHWQKAIFERFNDRPDLGRKNVYLRHFAQLDEKCVSECFDLIEEEYGVPPGLIRPTDAIEKLTAAVPATNPVSWFFYRAREGDIEGELIYQLKTRMSKYGTYDSLPDLSTFGDLINAWCGDTPNRRT